VNPLQVVECQERISERVAALRNKFERPMEGFAKAVEALSSDLRDVKRSIADSRARCAC
jgi:hypothetical protein